MKPEEALARMDGLAGRMERAPVAEFRVDAEALRIVLAMAKAAQGMARALEGVEFAVVVRGFGDTCPECGGGKNDGAGHLDTCDLARALGAFRKASGGDAPEGPKP